MDTAYTGKQIAQMRKALGLTQKELAEALHVTDKAVSKWERGVNFPDLGLMEDLAQALGTTPAVLLGLENMPRDEVVSSITEISKEQTEEAQRDLRFSGWCFVVAALLTVLAYWMFYDRDVREMKLGFPFLNVLTMVMAHLGWWLLWKYGEIKRLMPEDLAVFAVALVPLVLILGFQFLTGRSLNPFWMVVLTGIIAVGTQWSFCRIFRPNPVKALPMVCTLGIAAWHALDGNIPAEFWMPALCCTLVWFLCRRKTNQC